MPSRSSNKSNNIGATPPPVSELQILLREQQRLTRNDWLEVADQDDDNSFDAAFLEEFETAWSEFLSEQPSDHNLLNFPQEPRVLELQKEADAVLLSKIRMEKEMKQQIEFFRWGQEQSEKKFTNKIQETLEEQQKQRELLAGKIAALDQVERIDEETLPWFHFMKELDRLVEEKEVISKDSTSRKVARPSARALLLAKCGHPHNNNKHHQLRGDQLEWRASRIDHELMTVHSGMLQKEIERCETMLAINQEVGQFLNDLDIWSILKATDGSATSNSSGGSNQKKNEPRSRSKKA